MLAGNAGGNLDAAQAAHFRGALDRLRKDDTPLHSLVTSSPSSDEAHAKLVELTWDTIAAFMPATSGAVDGGPPTRADAKKLERIGAACGAMAGDLLDVGCGTGLVAPFLERAGVAPARYRGIDLSRRMIGAAETVHAAAVGAGASFAASSFDEERSRPRRYGTVLFNGSLQFFPRVEETLAQAAQLLASDAPARIIIAHVNGAAFVREEAAGNPATVRSTMPTVDDLRRIGDGLGMRVVAGGELAAGGAGNADEVTSALEGFYLVALQRDAL